MFLKNKKTTSPVAPIKGAVPSIISRNMHMLGNIVHDDGIVDFDGTLDGNIRCKILTVRPNGVIQGEVTVETLHAYGKIIGTIKAKNVYLYNGCHIEGIVMHEQLSIEDGAFIDGKCKRTDKLPDSSITQDCDGFMTDEKSPKTTKMLENIRLIR